MKVLANSAKSTILSRMVSLTPYQVYLEQVTGISDSIRASASNLDYYPMQLGGLKGQRQAITSTSVVEIMDFQSNGNS